MKTLTNTIKNKYYLYQPGEFLPVYTNGILANKAEFHLYKAKRVAGHIQAYLKAVRYEYRQAHLQ